MAVKKEHLKRTGRCFRRCKKCHRARDCRSSNFLVCLGCGRKHQTFLREKNHEPKDDNLLEDSNEVKVASTISNDYLVLPQTATVWVEGGRGRQLVRCLLDGGSQRNFVTTDAARRLIAKTIGEETRIFGFGKVATTPERKLRWVEFWRRSRHDKKEIAH